MTKKYKLLKNRLNEIAEEFKTLLNPFKRKNTANQQEVQYKKVYNTALKEKRAVSKR